MSTLSATAMERTVLALLFIGISGPAFAQTGGASSGVKNTLEMFANLGAAEQAEVKRRLAGFRPKSVRRSARTQSDTANRTVSAPRDLQAEHAARQARPLDRAAAVSKRTDAPDNVFSGCSGLVPLLRKDWVDIGFASCPQPVDKATGAEVSYSTDRLKENSIWSVNGTAALLYNSFNGRDAYTSTGAFVTVNRVSNSSLAEADANANSIAYGGLFEFGTTRETDTYYFANYFRVRGGAVQDYIKQTSAGTVTFEWLPVFRGDGLHIHDAFEPIKGQPLLIRIDPALLVQYARIVGGTKPLAFNDMNQALRIGPQVTLGIYPGTSEFFSHLVGSVTYHWAYETYSGRQLSWFNSSLTYNIDKDGHFGITATYQRGHDENTGVLADIYKLSFTGKI